MKIDILHEDNEILVVNKPAGIPSQPDKSGTPSLLEILSENYPDLFVIHRLDQRVSGIIVLAKTEISASQLSKDFQTRNVTKKYRAIVANQPKEKAGKLTHWLLKDAKKNQSKAFEKEVENSQKAELKYETVKSSERYHLLEIELFTGRFHQIRSQLSAIACPILGDLKYGYKRSSPDGSIFLQSYYLLFNHPKTKQALQFEIEMPELWGKYGF
ncbi:RluA family pseudouridine synthase [Arcicella sp. LKC2W]|uniref:RluA family pseudouridine synthase n=1 Tax=Arcicella sp. LKC2W TaxID=2984198 RepID=UPI002B216B16|nr:RluA family pseudouridine synthase [Arcicella sp. LKC2W]MEA5459890.1 RluA family pseudouridine synthase [Arcicella sp. LKC2W]